MKKVLGLDLGTNSIGWALVENDFDNKTGKIVGAGSRIIPMGQDVLGKFDSGVSISQTAERTSYRGTRRLYQRNTLRRERLHRVLNILGFLPSHYSEAIDFDKKLGQFKPNTEVKLNYELTKDEGGKERHKFLFMDSFYEMVDDFKRSGDGDIMPHDWTIYYLRKKALTQKVTRQELAWIILNFNQKRGYYQLRGEEEEVADNKKFVELQVDQLVDSGENVKGNILYDVYFTNGWKYEKQITKREDWEGRTKEFIVTIRELKDGSEKISYKVVDAESDWPAIKAKTEQEIGVSGLHVGEYIYANLLRKPAQKIKGKLVKTIERKFYKKELIDILNKQIEFHDELQDQSLLEKCINELYKHNVEHKNKIKNKGFVYLFVEDIIFYQRPLKSKKSSIGGCQFEKRIFYKNDKNTGEKKLINKPIKACPKSHPLYQEFRLWQFINNLRILKKEVSIEGQLKIDYDVTTKILNTVVDYEKLYEFLNTRKDVEQKNILKFLVDLKKLKKSDTDQYKWNYVEDKKYPCNETRYNLFARLKKVENIDGQKFLDSKKEAALWHIIYSVKDKEEYLKSIETFAKKNEIHVDSFLAHFGKMPPFSNDYGRYSFKALNKIIPLLRMGKYWSEDSIDNKTKIRIEKIISGEYDSKIKDRVRDKSIHLSDLSKFQGLPVWLSTYVIYDRHSEVSDIMRWRSPSDIGRFLKEFKQHSLRNPIVEQVVLETMRVVKDVWEYYGKSKEDFFDEIHLELGRSMKNSAEKRNRISKRNTENENTNVRIRELLQELMNDPSVEGDIKSYSPSHQEALKLYEEGVYQNSKEQYKGVSIDDIDKIRRSKSPSGAEITKYKLWLEQGYVSPYTGQPIPLSKLFTRAYDIEHIIPQSRYFDNSLGNKIICERDVNEDKGNKTAYEYIAQYGGSQIDGHHLLTIEEYEAHCNQYFKKNRSKLNNLLSDDIPEGFINRQLNDSRYISKYVKGLLSNVVRGENEQEATSKHLVPISGAITSKLKRDWGLNDKWNEIIAPRFKRLNELTGTQDFGYWDDKINAFRIQVPDELKKGFDKKRIDHRHHALDAIVIACTTRDHVNYITSINTERKNHSLVKKLRRQEEVAIKNRRTGEVVKKIVAKEYHKPWPGFPVEVKNTLEKIIVSFKQNIRVINKTNNKYWKWVEEDGIMKKKLVKQKGKNWAIRKPLHKETVSGKINMAASKGKIATAVRTHLSEIKNEKHIKKITDESIQKILLRHLESYKDDKGKPKYDEASSDAGIEDMNNNILNLNGGKPHMPIKKVRMYEIGNKFSVGHTGNNNSKYVEAAKGTNLFFAIYYDQKKDRRVFETVPFNEVIEHQKLEAELNGKANIPVQLNTELGDFLFTLSPNDLVYIPQNGETSGKVDPAKISVNQIYKFVSCTGSEGHFIPHSNSSEIRKNENGTNSKSERTHLFLGSDIKDEKGKGVMIKKRCVKLKIDRLGNIDSRVIVDNNQEGLNSLISEPITEYRKISKISINPSEEDKYMDIAKYVDSNSFKERLSDMVDLIKRAFGYTYRNSNTVKRINFQ